MTETEAKSSLERQNFNDHIIDNLRLITDPRDPNVFLRLEPNLVFPQLFERTSLENSSDLFKYFEGARAIQPDNILRPLGDTTFFTTAGVQHIETIIREKGELTKELFMVAQPVIRSQFMDKVKDGISTSFINFSVEYPYATPSEFTELTNKLILLILDQGVDPQRLKFQIENSSDKWGSRAFDNTFITIYLGDVELGECVYIHNYPVTEDERVPIADVSFGVERVNWAIGRDRIYFPGFDKFYAGETDKNKVSSIIDCIRTSVLIAGEDVKPTHYDPGRRLRQLLKRFVSRAQSVDVDVTEMIRTSCEYWQKWGFKPSVSEHGIIEIIKPEIDRSYNVLLLSMLEQNGGPRINMDVNQPTKDFLKQVDLLPKSTRKMIYEVIEGMR